VTAAATRTLPAAHGRRGKGKPINGYENASAFMRIAPMSRRQHAAEMRAPRWGHTSARPPPRAVSLGAGPARPTGFAPHGAASPG